MFQGPCSQDSTSLAGCHRRKAAAWKFPDLSSGAPPGGSDGKDSACNAGDLGSIPGLRKSPGGGLGNPLQYSCRGNPHGQRSLAEHSPWVCQESDTTEFKLVWIVKGGTLSHTRQKLHHFTSTQLKLRKSKRVVTDSQNITVRTISDIKEAWKFIPNSSSFKEQSTTLL